MVRVGTTLVVRHTLLVLANLLLDFVQSQIQSRNDRGRLRGGHKIWGMLSRNVDLNTRTVELLQIDRHLNGVDAIEKTPELLNLRGDDLLIFALKMAMTGRYIDLHCCTPRTKFPRVNFPRGEAAGRNSPIGEFRPNPFD